MSRVLVTEEGLGSEGRIRWLGSSLTDAWTEARESFRHAWPLVLTYVGYNMMGVVDTAMVGRLGASELAGVSIGNGLYFTIGVVGMGLVGGLDPIVSQAVGAKEGARVDAALRAGTRLAAFIAAPMLLAVILAPLLLPALGMSSDISGFAREFMWARAPGMIPFVLMATFRSLLQARGVTRALMWGAVMANVINLSLNPILIFGDRALGAIGLPAVGFNGLGVIGSGLASTLATIGQLWVLRRAIRALPVLEGEGDTAVTARRIAVIGGPIALTLLAEVGAFTIAGILAGRIGPEAGSGHQIAIQLASLTFTISMAIANATSVRVGRAVGRGDATGVKLSAAVGFWMSALYMSVTSFIFLFWAEGLARVMSDRSEVILAAVPLIHIAAAFQLFDGLQVVGCGALRGIGDTKSIQYATFFGYYVIGLPLAGVLAFSARLAERGLWWGLCAGLGTVAVFVVLRWRKLANRPIQRLA